MTEKISIKEVAAHAGVSIGTVSNVLNRPEMVSAVRRKKVEAAIKELNYVRNDAARQLKMGSSSTIGAVFLDATNPFFAEVSAGAEDQAFKQRNMVVVSSSQHNLAREKSYTSLLEQQQIRGLLITPTSDDLEHIEKISKRGVPVVLVDYDEPSGKYNSVFADDVVGGRLVVQHFLKTGHRKIAFVGANFHLKQVKNRLIGARLAIDEIQDATLEIIEAQKLTVIQGREIGYQIIERPEHERPEAIFCANDLLALGIMQAFAFNDAIKIPDEIALAGYDDISFASSAIVPLTTVQRSAALIGKTAVELLEQEIENKEAFRPRQVRFQPELIIRKSA